LRSQALPYECLNDPGIWKGRYRSIINLENHLFRNGTRTIKFFLHLSKEEQRKRFLKRIDDAGKNWKFGLGDIRERERWNDYREAYEDCLSATSTRCAPWYVVPADDKRNARLIISEVMVSALRELQMAYPRPSAQRRRELRQVRKMLAK
jgi:polyphosphate kinase 2 (PPK2 family)